MEPVELGDALFPKFNTALKAMELAHWNRKRFDKELGDWYADWSTCYDKDDWPQEKDQWRWAIQFASWKLMDKLEARVETSLKKVRNKTDEIRSLCILGDL